MNKEQILIITVLLVSVGVLSFFWFFQRASEVAIPLESKITDMREQVKLIEESANTDKPLIATVAGVQTEVIKLNPKEESEEASVQNKTVDGAKLFIQEAVQKNPEDVSWGIKHVYAGVTNKDLDLFQSMGIEILSGEWGMAERSPEQMLDILDRIHERNMKYVVNFTEISAWGYSSGQNPRNQKPEWQADAVRAYMEKIKHHPAIFGYDISNEAGENLPNGDRFRITAQQMHEAARTVREVDSTRPVLIRMHLWDNSWYHDAHDFDWRNPFEDGIADIVMLNLYSNFHEPGKDIADRTMVADHGQDLVNRIKKVDPDAEIWIALATFESYNFVKPTVSDLVRDIEAALTIHEVANISFFGWGYPSTGWYLPEDGKDLLQTIKVFVPEKR